MTALSHASEAGREGLVKALLAAGSKVDHADNGGWTSLMRASSNGYDECVKLLIEAKADVNASNSASMDGRNPYIWYTSLMFASSSGHPECFKLLLAAKANVNYTNEYREDGEDWEDGGDGKSALTVACEHEESGPRTEVIKLLIEAKADVNHADYREVTALMQACKSGNEAAVKLLIAAKADVDSADENEDTALMKAVDHPGIVKLLIEAKADVNRANARGYTALMRACVKGSKNSLAVVKLLLAVPGIDIDHVGNGIKSALSLAKAPKTDEDDEDEDDYNPEEWEEIIREREERCQRRLSLVPLLEEKMRQQAIDAEVAAAVKRIDAAAGR